MAKRKITCMKFENDLPVNLTVIRHEKRKNGKVYSSRRRERTYKFTMERFKKFVALAKSFTMSSEYFHSDYGSQVFYLWFKDKD